MAKAMTLFWVLVIIAMALVVSTAAQDRCLPCLTDDDCTDSVCCKVGTCPPDNSMGWCTQSGYECKEIGECGDEDMGYCEQSAGPAPAPVGTGASDARCNNPCLTDSDCSTDESSVCCKVGTCPPDNSRGWCELMYCYHTADCDDGDECKEIGQCGAGRGYCE